MVYQNMDQLMRSRCVAICISGILSGSCGSTLLSPDVPKPEPSATEKVFRDAAREFQIPYRFLLATALYESEIQPPAAAVPYLGLERVSLGFAMTETAFGISRNRLGLKEDPAANDISVQTRAYARWVSEQLSELELPQNPQNSKDKYLWLWQLALLHRTGDDFSRDNRILWALGLMDVLNQGRVWQDPAKGLSLELTAEDPAITILDFPEEARRLFDLRLKHGEIRNTRQLELVTHPSPQQNRPVRIEVTHCPMNLSACVEIQNNLADDKSRARLQAHYIIPTDGNVVSAPLQVTPHDYAVELTNTDGSTRLVNDAFVIMLAGHSGRINEDAHRMHANPAWFTPWQLKEMGLLSQRLCQLIAQDNPEFSRNNCLDPDHDQGVRFHAQPPESDSYKWGQIPDFDKTIFHQYVKQTITYGEAVFAFSKANKRFAAGTDIQLDVRFDVSATHVLLERAIRCPDQRVVWATIQSTPVRAQTSRSFSFTAFDGGPNGDGRYFLRALAYDDLGTLVGWAIGDLYLHNFSSERSPGDIKACVQYGTKTTPDYG